MTAVTNTVTITKINCDTPGCKVQEMVLGHTNVVRALVRTHKGWKTSAYHDLCPIHALNPNAVIDVPTLQPADQGG